MARWQGRVPLFVGVAGHRRLDPSEQGDIERRLRAFFADLSAQLPATPIVVVSRLAGESDQLAASAALAAGCEYVKAGDWLASHATLQLVLWDGPLSARAAIDGCGWREADVFNAAICAASRPELAATPAPYRAVPDEHVGDVATVLRAASMRAAETRTALARRKALLQSIAFLAAIAFAAYIKLGSLAWVLWLYLALLAGALAVRTTMRRQGLHRRYLDYRRLAEGLRVAVYWRIAGVSSEARGDSGGPRPGGGLDAPFDWVGSAITSLNGWMGRKQLPAGFDGCAFAAQHWLGSEAGRDLHTQIPYYRATAARLRRIVRRVEGVVSFTLITGVASAALLAVMPAAWIGRAAPVLIAIMGFMPLISGTASGAIDAPAEMEVVRQYEHAARLLARAARRFAEARTDRERRQILFEAGSAALTEQRVWHAVIGQKGPEGRARV